MDATAQLIIGTLAGAGFRVLLGIRKAYFDDKLEIDWKRVAIEMISSILFGGFAVYVLISMGYAKFEASPGVAAVGGLFGADLLNVLSRRIGAKKVQVDVGKKVRVRKAKTVPSEEFETAF